MAERNSENNFISPFEECVISDSDDENVIQETNNDIEISQISVEQSDESSHEIIETYKSTCNLIDLPKILPVNCTALRDLYKKKKGPNFEEAMFQNLKNLKSKWFWSKKSELHSLNVTQIALRNLEIYDKQITQDSITEGFEKAQYEAVSLHNEFMERGMLTDIIKKEFDHIYELIYYTMGLIQNLYCFQRALAPNYETYVSDEMSIYRFTPPDTSNNTPFQNLILYLLNTIYKKRYRRYPPTGEVENGDEKYCYKEIYTKSGFYTYAWKKDISVDRFVWKSCKKELNYEQWHNLTVDKTNSANAIKFLSKTEDPQFIELKKHRDVFSFKNGVYLAKNYNPETKKYYDRFYKYGDYPPLSNSIVSAKYFPVNFQMFENIEDWYDIPTPYLQSILDFQFDDQEEHIDICRWMYVLIGRMLYNVGDLDDWQVIAFIKGIAGTGKGTILTKIIKCFYEADDVGILSNDGETQFGLSGFHDKTIFIAPEIKGDLKLPQASFQSMISGEDLVVPVKYKTPQNIVWKTPGFLAGNETPNYTDNSGSLSRRLIIFAFMKKVPKKKVDPLLGKKLKAEIPKILKKSNLAYLTMVNKFGSKSAWDILPKYFIKNQQELSQDTNSLMAFLTSGVMQFDDNIYIRESTFKQQFNIYCKDNNLKSIKYNKDLFTLPFALCAEKHGVNIKVLRSKKLKYPRNGGAIRHGTFIQGIDLLEDDDEDEEDDL